MNRTDQSSDQRDYTPRFPLQTPLGPLDRFGGIPPELAERPFRSPVADHDKRIASLEAAFDRFPIGDGTVLSFHHHYRNGDRLLNAVVAMARQRGIKELVICPSSIFPIHEPLIEAVRDGTISAIVTDYMRGPLADFLQAEDHQTEVLLQSHGGRARAISAGQIDIDVAFVAAPLAHVNGATTGRGGSLACGPLGYPAVDACYAAHTVVAAHDVISNDLPQIDIPAGHVDAVVAFDTPGDAGQIQSGSTLPSGTPKARAIGEAVATVVKAAGLIADGMSLQSGAGGYSLAAVPFIGDRMEEMGFMGSFLSGGITGAHVALLERQLFQAIYDVQCFDLTAVQSSIHRSNHHMMSARDYASPLNPEARVNELSVVLLGAVEVDTSFNVNLVTGADGRVLGGPGGHPDTAQGAALSIVTTALTGGGYAKVVPQVRTLTTPGRDIDVVVTDQGIAVNPARPDIRDLLVNEGLPVKSIEDLARLAASDAHNESVVPDTSPPRILVEHRDGTILDWT